MITLKPLTAIFSVSSLFFSFFSKYVVYLIGLSLLLSGVVFLSGGSLKHTFPVFVAVCVLTMAWTGWEFGHFHGFPVARIVIFLLISNAIIAASTVVVTKIYDKSWDGMAYHQIAIVKLEEGWNPVYESLPLEPLQSKHFEEKITLNRYVNHYPKAHEIFATLWVGVTGRIESGKVFNVLIMLSAFCSVYCLLLGFQKIRSPWAFAIALAAAFNPIALSQLFSYYLDGAIGSLLVILITQLIFLARNSENKNSWPCLVTIFFLIMILSNMKFTALVYTVLFCLLFTIFLLVYKRFVLLKRFLLVTISAGLLAVGVIGFNPYVTNIRDFGHPFHPLAGQHKEDIISPHIPEEFIESNSFQRFIQSTFSESANFDRRQKDRRIKLKIPFTFNTLEMKAFQSEGVRLGGFGVLWSGIFLMCLILTCIAFYVLQGNERWHMLALLSAIGMSVAINPESWWARFIPQLWLFPVILCFFLICCDNANIVKTAKSMVIILILNTILVGAVAFSSTIKITIRTEKEFTKLRRSEKPILVYFDMFTPNERKLREKKIPFIKVNSLQELPCSTPNDVLKIEFCHQE